MSAFNGQLRTNEIFSALYNMIISQEVFADNLGKKQTLVSKAKVDGGLLGDTKLFYSTDVLASAPWGNDAEATNLLDLHRPTSPKCQAITLDQFRQICLTVDNYLSKRAWGTEGAFSSFNSVMLGWMKDTKDVFDGTTYNVFIGTTVSPKATETRTVDVTTAVGSASTELDARKLKAMAIAEGIADLLADMSDYSRDFNDNGFLRSYAKGDIKVIWNEKYINEIRKVELPVIYHKDGLVDKFDGEALNHRYFGRAVAETDEGSGKVINADGEYDPSKGTLRSKIELMYEVANAAADPRAQYNERDRKYYVHLFPGDELVSGMVVDGSGAEIDTDDIYVEDASIICKVLVKLPPFMSAFEVGTSFFNPKALVETHYLTWGHNTIEYLENYPFITIKAI